MFSEGVIGGSNIEALEVWSLSECWPAQGNADVLKIRQKNLPDNFPVCWLLLHLSRFLSGISRKDRWYYVAYVYNGELISLIGNQRVGIFPPKSEILFVLSLALIWCRNFQDRTIPVGGDTWTSFWRKDRIRIKKYSRSGLFFRSNISETVGDIRVLFYLWPWAIVALPNGANDVSVVIIVSEIWSRQHQNFGMLTCTSERNQYPFEWIRTANNREEE